MAGQRISIDALEAFDPHAPPGYPRRRFLCPLGGPCSGKEGRSLDVDVSGGCWTCHRCNSGGKLGDPARAGAYKPPAPPKAEKPKVTWQQMIERSRVGPLSGTPGQRYLEARGIPVEIAEACGVRFAGSWYNRASVLLNVKNRHGHIIAVQGRAIVGDAKITVGPKKYGVFSTPNALDGNFAIVEAPIDAMSLLLFDIPAIATCGSGIPPWLPEQVKDRTILIATDGDEQGDKDYDVWAPVLENAGARVKRYRPPHAGQINPKTGKVMKDWNDELLFRNGI